MLRQLAKKVIPLRWRRALREQGRRILYPPPFHLYPYGQISRYRPRESILNWIRYEVGFHTWSVSRGRGQRMERPIFMIGCPRSGTTVSVRLFGLHPNVANLSEAMEIWDPWHYRDTHTDHYWTAEDVVPKDAARLHSRFAHYQWFHKKERFINKNPRSSLRTDYIRAIFPDAVFIHVIRDGRAVAASMLERMRTNPKFQRGPMPFERPPNWRELVREDKLEQVALQWREIVSHILAQREELGLAYHEFKYEELCEDPRGVLGTAFRFAGLAADDKVLERLPERLENRNYKWKTELRPEQIDMITRIQEPLLAQLGYRVRPVLGAAT